jgi:hypothetical protein
VGIATHKSLAVYSSKLSADQVFAEAELTYGLLLAQKSSWHMV